MRILYDGKRLSVRPIPDFPNYCASRKGRIYSLACQGLKRVKELKPAFDGGHYVFVNLRKNNKSHLFNVHVLICVTFNGPKPDKRYQVSHEDGDRTNNKSHNLKWRTVKDNHSLKIKHGTDDNGIRNSRVMFSREDIINIRQLLDSGKTQASIGRLYSTNPRNIGKIHRKEHYSRTV